MNRTKIPIVNILIKDRQRFDLGDIDDMAESLDRYGLIQPVVINENNQLIAGERRIRGAERLGWTEIDVVYKETLSQDILHELELEENIKRRQMSWQELCLATANIHYLKKRRAALDSNSWGLRETADLLGIKGYGNLSYTLRISEALSSDPSKSSDVWQASNLQEAVDLVILKPRANEITQELARRHVEQSKLISTAEASSLLTTLSSQTLDLLKDNTPPNSDSLASERFRYYSNSLNPPNSFEEYWSARQKDLEESNNTVYISNRLHKGDSIAFMHQDEQKERFDAIVTDAPYGIDMEMLNQNNPHGGMNDISDVAKLHDIDYNYELLANFFPAAYACLKPNAYCVVWCDQMLWDYLYKCAIKCKFSVQRWPFVWVKTSRCMNQAANTNLTKCTEIAIVCRKGTPTLAKTNISNYVVAGRDDVVTQVVDHPFAKPLAVWQPLIEAVSIRGQHVYDPFMGKGSCALSTLSLRRIYTGSELDENHYNAALENVKQFYLKTNPKVRFK